jgi:ribonucleoside-diphosphate reductase beta chain
VFVAGYRHFLRTAASLQWDEAAIDLSADARAWPVLEGSLRARIVRILAGFCVGESAVAEEIAPFAGAAHDRDACACFRAQAVDERRHARFFDRVAEEVVGVEGSSPSERRGALRGELSEEFLVLFEVRLFAAARALAAEGVGVGVATSAGGGPGASLRNAVGLYHLLLEGIVFTAGQRALLGLLERVRPALPGLRNGLERVVADERWHVGLGARLLAEAGGDGGDIDRLSAAAGPALAAWGDAVDPELGERVLRLHRRWLAAALGGAAAQPGSDRSSTPPRTPLATATR